MKNTNFIYIEKGLFSILSSFQDKHIYALSLKLLTMKPFAFHPHPP